MLPHDLVYHPLFGISISVLAYAGALLVSAKYRRIHPLFLCSCGIIALLLVLRIPYEAYKMGGDVLALLLGPATVALGVPLYKHSRQIGKHLTAAVCGITAGSLASVASTAALVWLLGGSRELILTMMPKSVTSPIAIEISHSIGGIPELTAVLTVLTGLLGSMFGRSFLRLLGIRDDLSLGVAIGTAAHGIGTAKVLRDSEIAGSFSGFAMGLAGILTAVIFIPIAWWLNG